MDEKQSSMTNPLFEFEKTSLDPLQKTVLEYLETDSLVDENESFFSVSYEQAIQIKDIDRDLLGIPSSIPFLIYIGAIGTLNEPDFKFSYSFRKHIGSENELSQRLGHFIQFENKKYLPNQSQGIVLKVLYEFENQTTHSFHENLLILAKLKSQAKSLIQEGKLVFDKYLESENVEYAENVKLDFLENKDGSITVVPSIDHEYDESFKKAFDLFPQIKGVYNSSQGNDRLRVIIPKDKQADLTPLKNSFRKISGEMKESVLKNPSQYFDESLFNLDHYSKRVYELGYYEPKYYPFIRPFSTNWVSGVTIEEASGERVEILVENETEFEKLDSNIQEAKSSGSEKVFFKEKYIPINDAISLRDSFVAIKENRIKKEGFRDSNGRKVLIIHENVDGLDFSSEALQEITHVFIPPKRLKNQYTLLPHQIEGIAWMQSLSKSNSGAILGDDMGLGKTLQVLSFFDWSADYQEEINTNKPNLLVAPVTLLENWENEFKRFFDPHISFIKYYGTEAGDINLNKLGRNDVILTTYETLRSKQLILARLSWFSSVLDEAQRIKTPGTMVTNAAKALNAEFKVAMTGTPVENSWMDLWCLSDFIAPGLLGSAKEFNKKYNSSLKDEKTDINELGDEIRGQLGVYLKRRLKTQILKNLPLKTMHFLPREMPSIQKQHYLDELDHYQKNKGGLNQILTTISKLRMISDHPFLVLNGEEINSISTQSLIESSAKMVETISILEKIRELNEKVILFTHFEKVQSILSRMVIEYFKIPVSIINGQTATIESKGKESRQKLIDNFQAIKGFNVIIMSPIAAGYGLNVTEANHVIHYTRHWNPAKENQATDRVYRIGQHRPVQIYFPMAIIEGRETFDQKLDGLLKMKTQLSEASLYPSDSAEVKFSDFENLLV